MAPQDKKGVTFISRMFVIQNVVFNLGLCLIGLFFVFITFPPVDSVIRFLVFLLGVIMAGLGALNLKLHQKYSANIDKTIDKD